MRLYLVTKVSSVDLYLEANTHQRVCIWKQKYNPRGLFLGAKISPTALYSDANTLLRVCI